MNRISIFPLLTLLVLVSFCACKKDDNQPADALTGSWQEIGLTGVSRNISFARHKDFALVVIPDSTVNSRTVLSGTYQTKGDSLSVKITSVIPTQNMDVHPGAGFPELYEKATFAIKNDTLTLNYVSYPADAPVNTVAKFKKLSTLAD